MVLGTSVGEQQERDGRDESSPSELDDDESTLPPDDVYHLLQTRRRRDVLRYLRDAGGTVRLRSLAEQVAAWEHDTSVDALSSSQRQRVYISLYQSHLPKLDKNGVVDYDKDRGTVEPTALAAQLEPYLEPDAETADGPDPWPRRYAGTLGCCTLFLLGIVGGAVPLSGNVGALVVLGSFGAVTAAHARSSGVDTIPW